MRKAVHYRARQTIGAMAPLSRPEWSESRTISMKTAVHPQNAAAPKGPYSPGVTVSGRVLYVSAQGPFDPKTGEVVGDTFEAQVERVFENIKVIIEDAGASLADVVKLTVFITDWSHFDTLNQMCTRYFTEPYPARTPVKMELPGALFMADAVVALAGD
jgi:2-iminobutanoate/2-iminopropanoate deaminase